MRTPRYRLRLSTAALLVVGVVAASTTGHVLLKRSSTPSLEFISEQVARLGASEGSSASGSGASTAGGGATEITPVPMSDGYGGVSGEVADFLSLGGFPQGTANWDAALASGVGAVEDLMAQLEAPGAGGSIDGMQLASADGGLFGGQGGGSASGGGAGGEAPSAGLGSDAPLSFVEGTSGGFGGGGSAGGSGGSSGAGGGSGGGAAGVPGNGSADLPSIAAPVPEPSTYLMMLGGLAAVGTLLRRRREMIS